jgi:damage-control phosphatase, subfamily I
VKTYLDCLPCLVSQSSRAERLIMDDEQLQRKGINALVARIPDLSLDLKPPEIAQQSYRLIKEVTGNSDPIQKIKTEANAIALKLYANLKELVKCSKDPLLTACKLAIAGNSIDHGPDLVDSDIN